MVEYEKLSVYQTTPSDWISMNHNFRIAPSILSADFARLGEEVTKVIEAGADLIHFDVMDNHYVPNLTFGPMVCAALKPYATVPIDVHLMVEPVDDLIQAFAKRSSENPCFRFSDDLFCLIVPICFKRAGTGLWKLGLDRNIAAFPQKLTAKRLHGKISPVCRSSEFFRRPFTLFKRNPHVFAKHH